MEPVLSVLVRLYSVDVLLATATVGLTPVSYTHLDVYKRQAVLNDCKYGYSAKDGHIALTLLRSANDPQPKQDLSLIHI